MVKTSAKPRSAALHGAHGVDVAGEAVPGVGVGQGGCDGGGRAVHAVGEDGVDQFVAGGGAAGERGFAHARFAGDGGHGHAESFGSEAAGRGQDPVAVALGVDAQSGAGLATPAPGSCL